MFSRYEKLGVLAFSALLYADIAMSCHTPVYFAEPYSGKRVQHYAVDLYVSDGKKQAFRVPAQCEELNEALEAGADRWGPQVDRFLWSKVTNDCRYWTFVHIEGMGQIKDYVTNYDFQNARIMDFPMRWGCEIGTGLTSDDCTPDEFMIPDVSLLPAFEKIDGEVTGSSEDCVLENGLFRGRIMLGDSGIACEKDKHKPGFRVISVDYADVNVDGFLDVIVRVVPVGTRGGRAPVMYVLTRLQSDQPFQSVQY